MAGILKVGDALDAPKDALTTVKNKPWLAVGIVALVLVLVVLFEAYKPGFLTGPIRRFLQRIKVVKEGS